MEKFNELVKMDTPVLVDFFAEWCAPCKAMKPVLEEVKGIVGDKARILKIDVEKNHDLAMQLNIHSVPTLILFKNNDIVWRQNGGAGISDLVAVINQYVNK